MTAAIHYVLGEEVNGLIVLSQAPSGEYGQRQYNVGCSKCGNEFVIAGFRIRKDWKVTRCRNCQSFSDLIGPSANHLFRQYNRNARNGNRSFALTALEFRDLLFKNCHYCGREPFQTKTVGKDTITYNGIDRIDNNVGYTKENSVPCCRDCNMAKKATRKEDFLKWVDAVYQFQHEAEPVTYALCFGVEA